MYKTVFNFHLKKINTKSAFMSSWWSGYFYQASVITELMTVYRWHDLNNWRQMIYGKHVTMVKIYVIIQKYWTWKLTKIDMTDIAESVRKFWFWVNFWLKKNGERLLLWTTEHVNVRTNEHYSALNFFLNQKLRHIQNLRLTAQRR